MHIDTTLQYQRYEQLKFQSRLRHVQRLRAAGVSEGAVQDFAVQFERAFGSFKAFLAGKAPKSLELTPWHAAGSASRGVQ